MIPLRTLALALLIAVPGTGQACDAVGLSAVRDFTMNCFNPRLTRNLVQERLAREGVRVDFYDLDPFSNVAPTPPREQNPTPGTDRRCEIAFDSDCTDLAVQQIKRRLSTEGITREAALPPTHSAHPGTVLIAARQLNPRKIAVVHVGRREGPGGPETFLNVERLIQPEDN